MSSLWYILQKMEQNDAIYHLVIKYIDKETTEEETIEVLNWINADGANKILFFHIKDIVDALNYKGTQHKDAELIWKKVLQQNQPEAVPAQPTRKKRPFLGFIQYAAAILVICVGIFGYRQYVNASQTISISVALSEATKKINLPDHSVIWLKPGSSISYEAKFATRLINLKGDGFFSVTKLIDETGNRKPFTVATPKLEVSVLGTSFNVVDDAQQQDVIVKTGVVKVKNEKSLKTLQPGDRVQLLNGQLIMDHVNANLFMGWTDGGYKFENTGIKDIQELLALSYHCKVVVDHPEQFKNINLSGWVAATDEKTFLSTLQLMLSATITKQNNTITITTKAYD